MSEIVYADTLENVDTISTGLFIDRLSGIGGIPRGVITEIFGDEGIGKSSLTLQIVASAQRSGLRCLWADVEWCYDKRYAESLGVNNSKLGIIRERDAEATLDALEEAADSDKWDVIVLDSVGGILPRNEAEKSAEGRTIGSQAGVIAKFCRKIVPIISIHNVALIAINHQFTDIMSGKLMTSGGRKLAYHKALSIRLKAKYGGNVIKQGERRIGKVVVGIVHKNKVAGTEGLEVEAQLFFGEGFSTASDLLSDALERGILMKKGMTFYFGTEKLGVGIQNIRKQLESDAVLAEKVKQALHDNQQVPRGE